MMPADVFQGHIDFCGSALLLSHGMSVSVTAQLCRAVCPACYVKNIYLKWLWFSGRILLLCMEVELAVNPKAVLHLWTQSRENLGRFKNLIRLSR